VAVWPTLLIVHFNRFKKVFSESSGELLIIERLNTAVSLLLSDFSVDETGVCMKYSYAAL
jgi:hypothetical protein